MKTFLKIVSYIPLIIICACTSNAEESDAPGILPSDKQVIADITPRDKANVVDVYVTEGKSGEAYFHKNDLVWYFDRGAVVKRKANISGAPNAVVAVSGLARYIWVGRDYKFHKFLVTDNSYEGIPAPNKKELLKLVKSNLNKVFMSRDHTITEIGSVEFHENASWIWHAANSFTVPFKIKYKTIVNNTTIETREDVFDIRFYRADVDSPINNLMATEKTRNSLGRETYAAADIGKMKTLRDGL